MTSEAYTPESLIVQARDEDDIDKQNRQCIIGIKKHQKEHTDFEDVQQTQYEPKRDTNDDEQRKNNFNVGNENSEHTDDECFLYSPSIEEVAHDDMIRQSKDFPEGSDVTKITISEPDYQLQDSKKVATAEEADEQPTKRAGIDAEKKETSDNVISADQALESGQHNEEEVSNIKEDNNADTKHLNNLNLLEKKTVELPVCVLDQQLEGFKIDAKSEDFEKESTAAVMEPGIDAEKKETSDSVISANQALERGQHNEEEVSNIEKDNNADTKHLNNLNSLEKKTVELPVCVLDQQLEGFKIDAKSEDLEKESTAAVMEPAMAKKDEEEKTESSGLTDISMSHTSSSPIDSNKESISGTVEDIKEVGLSSWESIDAVEGKNGLHEAGKDYNLEEASKSFFEKEFEDMTRSSTSLKDKIETEDKNIESNTESQGNEMGADEGDQNVKDTISSKADSEIIVKGPIEGAVENPEEFIVKETTWRKERENLDETFTMISENIEAVETMEEITNSKQGEAELGMAYSEDQRNENNKVGAGNCDTVRIPQDNTTDFGESIISLNEYDLHLGHNTVAIRRGDEKQDVCTKIQPQEQEKQDIEVSKVENFHNEQASGLSKNEGFTSLEGNSGEVTKRKGVGCTTSITIEEKMSEFVEPDPEKRQKIESEEELTEAETTSESNLQESRTTSDAKEEAIRKDDFATVSISPQTPAERIKQLIFEVIEANISSEDIGQDDYKSKNPSTEKGKTDTTLPKEEHADDISKNMRDSVARNMVGCFWDELQNQISEESISGKGETNQELVEISPSQNEVSKIYTDSVPVFEVEATTDRQQENPKDEDLYNIINGVSAEQGINAENTEVNEKTHEHIASNEIQETETDASEDIVNQSSEESDSCNGKEGQEIPETYTSVIELEDLVPMNDECTRINNEEIEVREVQREAAIDTQQSSGETKDPYNITSGVLNVVENEDQEINTESDNIEELQDKKPHKQTGCNHDQSPEEVKNEENQRSEESKFSNGKQDQEKAKASTPIIEAKIPISSRDECTSISSEEVQVSEIGEEAAIDKQPCPSETRNLHEVEVELLLENENSKSILEGVNQDIKTQSGITQEKKDEKENEETCSNEIHETETDANEEIVNQSTKESDSSSGKEGQEIPETYTSVIEVEDLVPRNDECIRINNEKIEVSEVEKEAAIGKQQSRGETKDSYKTTSNVSKHMVEIEQKNENSIDVMENGDQEINAESDNIEELQDEKPHKQTGCNQNHNPEVVKNEENQSSEESNFCNGKQDKEKAKASTQITEAKIKISSKDECTNICSEEVQESEIGEEAAIDKQPCTLETSSLHEVKVELLLENENSKSILEGVNQDIKTQTGSIEKEEDEKENEETCSNEIYEAETVNNEEIVNQISKDSNSCTGTRDEEIAQASTPTLEAKILVLSYNECNMIASKEIQVREAQTMQECTEENPNKIQSGISSCEVTGVEIVQENVNYMNEMKDVSKDINNAESESIEVQIHEETGSNYIHKREEVNNEEVVSQRSEQREYCTGKEDQEISHAFTPLRKDECNRILSEEIQASDVEEEAAIDQQQCMSETETPNKTKTDAYLHEEKGVEVLLEKENHTNILQDLNQDINAHSGSIEVQNDKTNELSCLNEIHETKTFNNTNFVKQSSFESGSCSEKEDKDISLETKPHLEAKDLDPRNDECIRISIAETQYSETEGKAAIEEQDCSTENEHTYKGIEGVPTDKLVIVEIVQESPNSMNIAEVIDQNINADTDSIEVQQNDNTYDQTGSKGIHETEAANNAEIVNQSTTKRNSYSGKEEKHFARASTPLLEAENPVQSNEEISTTSEETGVSEEMGKAETKKQQCSTENENSNNTSGLYSNEFMKVEIVQEIEDSMNIVEGVNQDINAKSNNIKVLQEENTHEQTCSNNIHEAEEANNKETMNKITDEKYSCCGKQNQDTGDASTPLIEAEDLVQNKDERPKACCQKIQAIAVDEAAIDIIHCSLETEDANNTREGVYSNKVIGVMTLLENQNYKIIGEDEKQDMSAQLGCIEVQKDEKTNEKNSLKEIHESEAVNNEEIVSQSFKENDSSSGKQDQEIAPNSTLLFEIEDQISSNDENTRITSEEIQVSEDEKEAAIVERQFSAHNEDPKKIEKGVSSIETRGVEISQDNGNVINIVEDVDQDVNVEAQRDAKAHKETSLYENHDRKVVNHEDIVNQSSEYQGSPDASSPAEQEIRNKDECTKITREEIQVSEVEDEVAFEKQQPNTGTKDENKITNDVSPSEVKRVQINHENKCSLNIKQYMDQEINAESENTRMQKEEEIHGQIGSHQIHKTEEIDNEEIVTQNSYGKQDQEIVEASILRIEDENLVVHKNECLGISSEEIQVTAAEEEAADPDMTENGISSYEIREVEVVPRSENSMIIVENNQQDIIDAQKDEKTHEQNGFNEIHETQAVNNEEFLNECSEESDYCNRKQYQEIAKASSPFIEAKNPASSKDECTGISSGKVQEVEEEPAIDKQQCSSENKDPNEMKNGVSCMVKRLEILPENENNMNIMEDEFQDINVQPYTTEVQKDEKVHEKTCKAVNYMEIENQSSNKGDPFSDKQDEGIAEASTPGIEAQNPIPSKDERTGISSEDFHVSQLEEEETIKKQLRISQSEDPKNIKNDVSSYENLEQAATMEVLTWCSELIELREANSNGNNAINRNVEDHNAKSTGNIIGNGFRETETEEIFEDKGTTKKANDTDQVKSTHTLYPEDERNVYDTQFQEGNETPELSKSYKVEESLSFTQNKTMYQEIQADNFRDRTSDQHTLVGTSGEYGSAENFDPGQSAKMSNDHSKLIEFNKAAGFESEQHKHENEGPEDMNSLGKEVLLKNDPTLSQQNLQENASLDKEDKTVMREEQEKITELSDSSADDGTDVKATREGSPEHKDAKEFSQIQNIREFDIPHIQEHEQDLQDNCDKLPASSQFRGSCSNVLKEEGIGNKRQLHTDTDSDTDTDTDSKEEPQEHNQIEACAQKGITIINPKRNGVSSQPPNDPVKGSIKRAEPYNISSIASDGYSELKDEILNITQTHSITPDKTNKQQEIILHKETNKIEKVAAEKPQSDEENDEESESKLSLIPQGLREIDPKATQKKSQNILSGVGSKVKHSISKVKKAITCSSSQFTPEDVIIKLNKNKKSSNQA
ncbi:uncharacterized protein [Spinacia oleracea]|uniref:Uncharacterized protein isoform X3 n=1 Tax=Spinacia oleracea TaxID=3562 RepID=A0A9R0JQ68_SPIOL|nr:uncharacterized protein LOC110782668 isoform X3 [Spinacia oleracea]